MTTGTASRGLSVAIMPVFATLSPLKAVAGSEVIG